MTQRYKPAELTHDLRIALRAKRVRIWSGEHGCYWRANAQGYTARADEAGVYGLGDAWRHTAHCGPEKKIELEVVA